MKNEIKQSHFSNLVTGFLYAPYETYRVTVGTETRGMRFWFTLGWMSVLISAVGLLIAAAVM